MESLNIEIVKGATFSLPVSFVDVNKEIIDITGWTAKMQIRQVIDSIDPPIVDLTTENGGILIDVATGTMTPVIDASVTALLTPMDAVYDFFVIQPGGNVQRYLRGCVSIEERVTR